METEKRPHRVLRPVSTTVVEYGVSSQRDKRMRFRHRVTALALAAVVVLATLGLSSAHAAPPTVAAFTLHPNPPFAPCLAASSTVPPQAQVEVNQGTPNDQLTLFLTGVKPHLAFDLFTTQHTNLLPDGAVDPHFNNFGLAWYQSDIQADSFGRAMVQLQSIFVNQIFGFDPAVGLGPTNTFHIGFWFNNPQDAQACGFDVTHPTPFNGEHRAGPNAMMSVPNATTGLGPLCLNPNTSTHPPSCNP